MKKQPLITFTLFKSHIGFQYGCDAHQTYIWLQKNNKNLAKKFKDKFDTAFEKMIKIIDK